MKVFYIGHDCIFSISPFVYFNTHWNSSSLICHDMLSCGTSAVKGSKLPVGVIKTCGSVMVCLRGTSVDDLRIFITYASISESSISNDSDLCQMCD